MNPKDISIDQYNYPLPDERIARHPLQQRDACKLLVASADGSITDHIFNELPELLPAGAILVYNNTRVINARVRMNKNSGAGIEIFCLEPDSPADYERNFASVGRCSWQCLVGNSKKWKDGNLHRRIEIAGKGPVELSAERVSRGDTSSVVEFSWNRHDITFSEIIGTAGEIPIPPYLNRDSEEGDATDYQTVFSEIEGSVAAPTAGLHFTPELLEAIEHSGIERQEVTLHVGAGTFRPVKAAHIGEHEMHSEFITVGRDTIAALRDKGSRPLVAVGTTSVRTLESLYHIGCLISAGEWTGELGQWVPYTSGYPESSVTDAMNAILDYLDARGDDTLMAHTRIIIAPGYRYRIVDGMITNFHQPQSTLLLLVSAFIGENWRKLYDHALASDYRFLSYGDACLLFPQK